MLRQSPDPALQELRGIGEHEHRDGEAQGVEAEQDNAPRQLSARADHREDARKHGANAGHPDKPQRHAKDNASQPPLALHPNIG